METKHEMSFISDRGMEQKIGIRDGGVDYILSRHRTGLSPQADVESGHKKSFFQHNQIFAKVSFTQPKTYFFLFFITKCKNAPGVAGADLQTVTD